VALGYCQGECRRLGLFLELVVQGLGVSDEVERVAETRVVAGTVVIAVVGTVSTYGFGCHDAALWRFDALKLGLPLQQPLTISNLFQL